MGTKNKIYFASPFFTEEQVEREERLKEKLRSLGFKIWSPKENCNLRKDATPSEQEKVFMENISAISECDGVFAVTDGKDIGTVWEAGFAFGIGKPVIYYCETLPVGGQFNLMLARSGNLVIQKKDAMVAHSIIKTMISEALSGTKFTYGGLIE